MRRRLALSLLSGCISAAPLPGAQSPDSLTAYREARKAETEYEWAARRLAPVAAAPRSGETCDEVVGRFCLYYDAGRDSLPPEPAEIRKHRQQAIEALQRAWALNNARPETVYGLIRLLVEDKRAAEAVVIADRFRTLSSDVATAASLVLFTRFAAGQIELAEAAVTEWLAVSDSGARRRLSDISQLIGSRERREYRRSAAATRLALEALFWRYADALYITPGNETRAEHFARHAETRLIQSAPWVRGSSSWGRDVEELTIRFGSPRARTRVWPRRMGATEDVIIEHWDPEQLMYAPPSLDSVLQLRARPGHGWPLDTVRSISGHAPTTFRRMMALEHQATRYRTADGVNRLRVDGLVAADSAPGPGGRIESALFVLDDSLRIVASVPARTQVRGDTILFSADAEMPPGAAFYSAELLDHSTRLASRARFRLARDEPVAGISISDMTIADAFAGELPTSRGSPSLKPRPTLITRSGEPFGLMVEVMIHRAPDSVRVEVELLTIQGRPAVIRAARWVGRRLGLVTATVPTRLAWKTEVVGSQPTPLPVTLDPAALKPGRYYIDLSVTTSDGKRAVARREIVIREP